MLSLTHLAAIDSSLLISRWRSSWVTSAPPCDPRAALEASSPKARPLADKYPCLPRGMEGTANYITSMATLTWEKKAGRCLSILDREFGGVRMEECGVVRYNTNSRGCPNAPTCLSHLTLQTFVQIHLPLQTFVLRARGSTFSSPDGNNKCFTSISPSQNAQQVHRSIGRG